MRSPLAWPARHLPVVAPTFASVEKTVAALTPVVADAQRLADFDPDALITGSGGGTRLDADALRDVLVDADRLRSSTDVAATRLRELTAGVPALAYPVRDALDSVSGRLDDAVSDLDATVDAGRVAQATLAPDAPATVLVVGVTTSEPRPGLGMPGSWSLLSVGPHVVPHVVASGRVADLNPSPSNPVPVDDELAADLGPALSYDPTRTLQNATMTPSAPPAARLLANAVEHAGVLTELGLPPITATVLATPEAAARLATVTGPVTVDGWAEPLSADNLLEVLAFRQYLAFEDPSQAERSDFLAEVVAATLSEAASADLFDLASVVADAVAARELAVVPFTADVADAAARVSADGAFPPPSAPSTAWLSVSLADISGSKVAYFTQRHLAVDVNSAVGTVTASLELRNTAPVGGGELPDYVVGGGTYPRGTAAYLVALRTDAPVVGVTRDGVAWDSASNVEPWKGRSTERSMSLAPGERTTITWTFALPAFRRLSADASGRLDLLVVPQASVGSTLTVSADGVQVLSTPGRVMALPWPNR